MSTFYQKIDPLEPLMSSFLQENDPLAPLWFCPNLYDEILVLAEDLLKDECPISQVDEWLYRIDDTSLQLKLWGETLGVKEALMGANTVDKNINLVISKMLRRIISSLHKIELLCKDTEADDLPQIKSKISAAIDEFQASTNPLTDTVELFRHYKAKSNVDFYPYWQELKPPAPTGSIAEYFYSTINHHRQDFGQKEQEQPQRISRLPSQSEEDSSYVIFLHELGKMSYQEKQVIRFGELAILSEQILKKIRKSEMVRAYFSSNEFTLLYTEEEILEVAETLLQFYRAYLEATSTIVFAGSDAKSRAGRLPNVAKIWLIVHEMKSDHLLDYFCAKSMTDESLPLDVSTLEHILPFDEKEYPSRFAKCQLDAIPGLASRVREDKLYKDEWYKLLARRGKPYLGSPAAAPRNSLGTAVVDASFAGTTTPTGDPLVEGSSCNQPTSTQRAFASTSPHTGDPKVDETPDLR